MDIARKILKEHGLHITTPRLIVLEIFLHTPNILDHAELMYLCKENVNRITLYRTLHLFYQHHLLLKVPSSNGITKYLYRGLPASARKNKLSYTPERKIHLICQDCGRIISLEDANLPPVHLPKNFEPSFMDLIVNGKCRRCSRV
jgi:Fur family transcriptional regulator, ferric uptake regulator